MDLAMDLAVDLAMDSKAGLAHSRRMQRPPSVSTVPKSASVTHVSAAQRAVVAIIIFFIAHAALLVG
jgi:hypothetical protein